MTQKGRFRMEFSKTNYIFIISDFPPTFEALRGSADFGRFKSADFRFGSYFYHFWPKSQCGVFFQLNFCHWTQFCCRNQKIPRILEFFGIYGISPQIWHICPFFPNGALFHTQIKALHLILKSELSNYKNFTDLESWFQWFQNKFQIAGIL